MVVFALNTGLRCGDIFKLKWEEVNFEERRLDIIAQKSAKPLTVPLNETTFGILEAWQGIQKGPYVFYNHMTGDRFRISKRG